MMAYETLLVERRDGVAHVILNRPQRGNALDLTMARELMDAAMACDEDRDVRAVVLRGSGKLFCAGGDLGTFHEAGDGVSLLIKTITTHFHAAVSRFARMRAPVIAAVHGAAAGGGMSLACAADLVLAAPSARFTMAYTRIGFTPDGSASWFLPRLIGLRRTQELMLTNRTLTAEEALAWGMITRVVAEDALVSEAEKLAMELASGPTGAFGGVKRLLHASASTGLETQMELETREIAAAAGSAEGREGVAAFLAKRSPSFR